MSRQCHQLRRRRFAAYTMLDDAAKAVESAAKDSVASSMWVLEMAVRRKSAEGDAG